jgi:putative FmdB family regulatory protein
VPNYDYQCKCGDVTEHQVPSTQKTAKCPECGLRAKRLPPCPNAICRYSLMERNAGNPRVNRGKGRR